MKRKAEVTKLGFKSEGIKKLLPGVGATGEQKKEVLKKKSEKKSGRFFLSDDYTNWLHA